MADLGEDLCYQCIKAGETTEEEIININLNKYSSYILEDLINEYINNYSLIIINRYKYKTYIENINEKYIYEYSNIYIDNFIYYYTSININDIIINDLDINRPYIKKLICYNPIKIKTKLNQEQKKNKNNSAKFNKKYNKLVEINNSTIEWVNGNLLTEIYKKRVINTIKKHMIYLTDDINKNGKNLLFIQNTYEGIFCELHNQWEFDVIEDDEIEDKKDFKLVYNQKWKQYALYNDLKHNIIMKNIKK